MFVLLLAPPPLPVTTTLATQQCEISSVKNCYTNNDMPPNATPGVGAC